MTPDQFNRLAQEIAAAATVEDANEILSTVNLHELSEDEAAKLTDAIRQHGRVIPRNPAVPRTPGCPSNLRENKEIKHHVDSCHENPRTSDSATEGRRRQADGG